MNNDVWKFSELKYARPDLKVYKDLFADAILRVEEAETGEDVMQLILEVDEMTRKADDLVRVAFIRHSMDTKDPFYDEQQRWFDENLIYYDQAVLNFREAVYNSRFKDYIEEKLGKQYFIDFEVQQKTFNDDCIELYQRESELCTEYYSIIGMAKAEVFGESKNISELKAMFGNEDRNVRSTAFKALSKILSGNEKRLEEIFDELIKVRSQIAEKLGYESYVPVGYYLNHHIDYTPDDIEVFRKQVVEEVVPLCEKLYKVQEERLGIDLMVYDEKAVFPDGNLRRVGDDEHLIKMAREMYNDISQETGEFIDYMLSHELFEYKNRPEKEQGGYGLILLTKKAPFVFTHFDGTIADYQVIAGELGEAFARYVASRTQPIKEYYSATGEIMEIYALSMCLFAYNYADKFFGENAERYKYYNMQELITLIPAGCAIDEFNHICYSNPNMTPKERTAEWRRLEKKYLPWREYDGDEFFENGGYFYSVPHVLLYPFYYINYALARVHALEMRGKYVKYPEVTWQKYMHLIEKGGRIGYAEVVEQAELTPLFKEGGVKKAMSHAKEVMETYIEKEKNE